MSLAAFGHSLGPAGALVGVDDRAAEIRAEAVVAAGQILDLEIDVHRVGRPAEEHDVFLVAGRALHLGQHALLARFDQLEILQAELVALDEVEDEAVAVVAGLDAEDLALERILELLDVAEILEALVIGVLRHGERVFGADRQVGADLDDRLVLDIGLAIVLHRRLPIAEEHVDVLVLHRGVGHGHREDRDLRGIAEALEDFAGDRGRRGDVGPADVGESRRSCSFRDRRRKPRPSLRARPCPRVLATAESLIVSSPLIVRSTSARRTSSADQEYRRAAEARSNRNDCVRRRCARTACPNRLSFASRAARSGRARLPGAPMAEPLNPTPAAAVRNPDAGAAAHAALRRSDRRGEVRRPRDGRRGQGARLRQGHGASGAVGHQSGGRARRRPADRHRC